MWWEKTLLGLSTACFGMFSKGCGNVQDLVCLGWIKSGERKELRWIGNKQLWEKSVKKGTSVCLLEPCLHLITPICSAFSLKPIFIWFKPECSFWSEWVCVSTANVMLVWLASSRGGLSGAAAAGLRAGGLLVQVPARLSERQVRTEWRCNLPQTVKLLARCHRLQPYEVKQVVAISGWEPGSAFFSPLPLL